MQINRPIEQSKFQRYSDAVLSFLEDQQTKQDAEKLIYSHQIDAVLAVKQYFSVAPAPVRPALVVAPTGAGKTGIVALLPYVLASPKVMILSPSLVITNQLEMAFGLRNDVANESFYFERRMIEESSLNDFLEKGRRIDKTEQIGNMKKYNLVIVNAQKFGPNSSASLNQPDDLDDDGVGMQLLKTRDNITSFTTLIVDEAHHYPADTWDLICQEFRGKQIIFLTATPFRGSERKELWENQKITYRIQKESLINKKIIRPIEYENWLNCVAIQNPNGVMMPYEKIQEKIHHILDKHDGMEPSIKHKAMVLVASKDLAEDGASSIEGATYFTSDSRAKRNLKQFED